MPNRIIKESICYSPDIHKLKPEEEVFFYRLLVNCDDYGRFDARLPILKARLYPLHENMRTSTIKKYLKTLTSIEPEPLIFLYEYKGIPYLQMTKWEKHQQIRAHRSKYPSFEESLEEKNEQRISTDINGYQRISDTSTCYRNPIQSESNPNPNPNPTPTENIFNHFISKKIITHKELTKEFNKDIEKALKENTEEEIKTAIDHYATMYHDKKYTFCNYKWGVHEFLTRAEGYKRFLDDGSKWLNYLNQTKVVDAKSSSGNFTQREREEGWEQQFYKKPEGVEN